MNCSKCHFCVPNDSEFCPYCGSKISMPKVESQIGNSNNKLGATGIPSVNEIIIRKSKIVIAITIPCLLLFCIFMLVCLGIKDTSEGAILYIIPAVLSAVSGILMAICFRCSFSSLLLFDFACLFNAVSIITFAFDGFGWFSWGNEQAGEWILAISLGLYIISLITQLYYAMSLHLQKYHHTAHYKMKCYEKLDKMNTLKEKGIIPEEEFEKLKKQIIEKTIQG